MLLDATETVVGISPVILEQRANRCAKTADRLSHELESATVESMR